ncbi:MAG: MFS transporter [Clostridia bacterium]|nr:MFS transporter [Clostridia bacterium]
MTTKLSKKTWLNIVLFGLMGQIAWSVENMYFNTFLFNKIGGTTDDINKMVAASAAVAVLTTFVMGAFSDRLGKRKPFICFGYILWGVTVMAFAFISRENTAKILHLTDSAQVVAVTVSIVVIMDCLMTFMGSTCNDAAFNAWVTDTTDTTNRGTVESVNAMLPIAAALLVTVGFGAGATALGYGPCFIGLGLLVVFCGLLGLVTLKETKTLRHSDGNYLQNLIYGFRPSVIKENRRLYVIFTAQCISAIAMQVIMPYLFIYLQHYLGFDFNSAIGQLTAKPLLLAVAGVVVVAVVVAVIGFGKLTDKKGKDIFLIPAVALQIVGFALAFPMKHILSFAAAIAVYGLGALTLGIILSAAVRDNTPTDRVGAFQGVRMIFNVLLPMVIGPKIGTEVISHFSKYHTLGTYLNDYGETVASPVPEIFAFAAGVSLFLLIPAIIMKKKGYIKPEKAK